MGTVAELIARYKVEMDKLGNVEAVKTGKHHSDEAYKQVSVSEEQRKAELLKLAPAIKDGSVKKTEIIAEIKRKGGRLTPVQVNEWLGDAVPVQRRSKAAEGSSDGGGKTYTISEMEYFALESIKKDAADLWQEALKNGFEIKKRQAAKELSDRLKREEEALFAKMDAERDALLEKLTNPAK